VPGASVPGASVPSASVQSANDERSIWREHGSFRKPAATPDQIRRWVFADRVLERIPIGWNRDAL
jgi:hypothetical protein